jgi:hypothetical protein
LQGRFIFFVGSDALGIGATVIHRMHNSGVKHMLTVKEFTIKVGCFS